MSHPEESALQPSWWVRALAALPLGVLHGLSRILAFLASSVLPYKPAVIRQSLALAFPDKTSAEIKAIRREFYRSYGDVMVEIVKSASMTEREFDDRMQFTNFEIVREAISSGTPAVLLAGHQCNWEWLLLGMSKRLNFPVDTAYKPLKSATADREMRALRSRFGARMIPIDRMTRDILVRRRVPRLIVLAADQEPVASDRRHWTQFLNRDTAFFMGGDVLASSLNYPVFFATICRTGRGRYSASFELMRAKNEVLVLGELTERFARRVERQIHESPADWPWSHKRWRLRRT
ncbi:MAG: lipid A biosynthesis acyltransferase [Gammaproteobacteria bacterium]|nr:lipid A biosynthesis acyltransferase [Gammaproteobacteria bacterium]